MCYEVSPVITNIITSSFYCRFVCLFYSQFKSLVKHKTLCFMLMIFSDFIWQRRNQQVFSKDDRKTRISLVKGPRQNKQAPHWLEFEHNKRVLTIFELNELRVKTTYKNWKSLRVNCIQRSWLKWVTQLVDCCCCF